MRGKTKKMYHDDQIIYQCGNSDCDSVTASIESGNASKKINLLVGHIIDWHSHALFCVRFSQRDKMIKKPAIFLDQDNTLNVDVEYTYKLADFRWVPGAPEALQLFTDAGLDVFIVTNQAVLVRPSLKMTCTALMII